MGSVIYDVNPEIVSFSQDGLENRTNDSCRRCENFFKGVFLRFGFVGGFLHYGFFPGHDFAFL